MSEEGVFVLRIRTIFKKEFFSIYAVFLTLTGFAVMQSKACRLESLPWYPIDSQNLINVLIVGPIVTLLLPWHGWVIFFPVLMGFIYKAKPIVLSVTFILVWLSVTFISTFFNFENTSFVDYVSGLPTYFFIFLLVSLGLIFVKMMFNFLIYFKDIKNE